MHQKSYCYILWSEKIGKFYIGITQSSIEERISKHNSGFYDGKKFTKIANDWVLHLKIEVEDFAHAMRIERKIKSMKSSKYIQNLKKYPELVIKIINETISK